MNFLPPFRSFLLQRHPDFKLTLASLPCPPHASLCFDLWCALQLSKVVRCFCGPSHCTGQFLRERLHLSRAEAGCFIACCLSSKKMLPEDNNLQVDSASAPE